MTANVPTNIPTTNPPRVLLDGLDFLAAVTSARVNHLLHPDEPMAVPEFRFRPDDSPLAGFIEAKNLTLEEFLLLFTALAPHLHPNFFGSIIARHVAAGTDLPEFGGVKSVGLRTVLPTGDTVLFLLAGLGLAERLRCARLLQEHWFFREKILLLDDPADGEPLFSGKLSIARDWLERLTQGTASIPRLSGRFPAQHLSTQLEWADLILPEHAQTQLQEIKIWVEHHQTLLQEWGMADRLKPGYRALFYGPPGTGKTLAATLLGKYTDREVFRVDLATLVSKYIGETEKNLAALFDLAEHRDWILFFDEADSIFGKRTQVRDAHDKYANQEVSYLLQRMETFAGVCILASNFRANLDDAFVRRFQSIVYFPMPRPAERLAIWQRNLPAAVRLAPDASFEPFAERYELTGSNIVNIIQYCCLQALNAGGTTIEAEHLMNGVQRELVKENKVI